jgi:capsular exopolysaccharide synthesis family protein
MSTPHSSSAHNSSNPASQPGFREFVAALIRGRWVFVGVFSGVIAVTCLALIFMGRIYEATASVLINTRYSDTSTPLFIDPLRAVGLQNTLQNELEKLKSRALADTVIALLIHQKYLDPGNKSLIPMVHVMDGGRVVDSIPPYEQIIRRLEASVRFEIVRESDVIRITGRTKDPLEVALVANVYAKAYRDGSLFTSRSKSRSTREYLQGLVSDKQRALGRVEDSLKKYMERSGVVFLDDDARRVIDQLSQLKATREGVDISIHTLQKTLSSYQDQLASQEKDVAAVIGESNDPYIRLLQEQLAKLEVQRAVTTSQNPQLVGQELYSDKLKEIDGQIAALRKSLKTRTQQFLKTIVPSQEGGSQQSPASYLKQIKQKMLETQIELQALQAKRAAIDEPIRQYESQFERIPAKSLQFARLQRDKQSLEKLFTLVEEKFNQVSLVEQSEFGYVEIVDYAVVPFEPASPKALLTLVLGLAVGMVAAVGTILVREYITPRVQSPEDVKKRGWSVLASIGRMNKDLKRIGESIVVGTKKKAVDAHIVSLTLPFSLHAESYRRLRTNLRFRRGEIPIQTILITSGTIGEGKSTTVANLAAVFAQEGKKVLLVDADLRRPVLHTMLDLNLAPGLSELLASKPRFDASMQETGVNNLHFISCGRIPPNPSELLGSEYMKEFLAAAKKDYDLVLLDSSPVLQVTDPCILSTLVDEVILVVLAGETSLQALDRTVDLVQEVRGEKPQIVLNCFDPWKAYGMAPQRYGYEKYSYGQNGSGDGGKARKGHREPRA